MTRIASGECQVSVFTRPADLDVIKRNPSLKIISGVGFNVGFVAYNTQHPPLDRVQVRRALDMAIDEPAIIQAVFAGNAKIATNPMPPAQWSYSKTLKDAPCDPAKARALLAQAGLPNGFDITLWAMPVQRPYNPNAQIMAQLIQQGVTVRLRMACRRRHWTTRNRTATMWVARSRIARPGGWVGRNSRGLLGMARADHGRRAGHQIRDKGETSIPYLT